MNTFVNKEYTPNNGQDKRKTKEIVEDCLRNYQECRNSDTWLILTVLRKLGFKIYIDYKEIQDMPSFETITRIRRKLQEDNKCLAELQVRDLRKQQQKTFERINEWW